MKIHARILFVAAAASLLAAIAAQAQPPAPPLDHPGYITQAPGPRLPSPMPDAGPFPDDDPLPQVGPMPGSGPMPAPGPMPYTQPTQPAPYTQPMPGAGMPMPNPMPGAMPMPGSMPMPGAAPCATCGQNANAAPIPNEGPMPYGMPGPHQGPMPYSNMLGGSHLPPGAFPYVPPRIIHYGWPGIRIYRRDVPMPQPKPDPTSRETKFVHPRSARLEIRTNPPARIYVDGEELDCVDGVYMVEPPKPLIPGQTYMHSVRVEGFDPQGREIARTIVVYLRIGRVTELTFY